MRIAIPLADQIADQTGQEYPSRIADEFSDASDFAIYDIHDDTRVVKYVGRETLEGPACSRTPAFLRWHQVEVILARSLSENAERHLLEAGIVAIKDAPPLSPDALIAHLVSGTLQATPPATTVEQHGCASGGCGHCCGGHSQAADPCETKACAQETHAAHPA